MGQTWVLRRRPYLKHYAAVRGQTGRTVIRYGQNDVGDALGGALCAGNLNPHGTTRCCRRDRYLGIFCAHNSYGRETSAITRSRLAVVKPGVAESLAVGITGLAGIENHWLTDNRVDKYRRGS